MRRRAKPVAGFAAPGPGGRPLPALAQRKVSGSASIATGGRRSTPPASQASQEPMPSVVPLASSPFGRFARCGKMHRPKALWLRPKPRKGFPPGPNSPATGVFRQSARPAVPTAGLRPLFIGNESSGGDAGTHRSAGAVFFCRGGRKRGCGGAASRCRDEVTGKKRRKREASRIGERRPAVGPFCAGAPPKPPAAPAVARPRRRFA